LLREQAPLAFAMNLRGNMGKRLRKAPLIEALLEVRWGLRTEQPALPPVDPAYPIIAGLLYDRVKKEYPHKEELPQSRFPPDILQYSVTHRFRVGAEQWPLVQIGPGLASINFTQPYSWRKFKPSAMRFLGHLTEAYKVAADTQLKIQRAMLRYINAIDLQSEDTDVLSFLAANMHTSIDLPLPRAATAEGVASPRSLNFEIAYFVPKIGGDVSLSISTGKKHTQRVLFCDLIAVSTGDNLVESSRFSRWLTDAHSVLEGWFFALIRGDLYKRFLGEETYGDPAGNNL